MKPPPQLGNRSFYLKKCLRSKFSKSAYAFGLDGSDLAFQEWHTCGYLIRLWIAIVWRAAFDDIADIDIFPGKMHRGQNPV